MDCVKPPVTVDLEEAVLRLKEVGGLLRQQISKYDGDLNLAIKTCKLSIVRKAVSYTHLTLPTKA